MLISSQFTHTIDPQIFHSLCVEWLQVLIFSQFKIMMDVLEDSFRLCQYPVERIDGSVSSRDRQAAIDRYSKGEDPTTSV